MSAPRFVARPMLGSAVARPAATAAAVSREGPGGMPPTSGASSAAASAAASALPALGPLAALAVDGVSDIVVNSGRGVWVDDGEGFRRAGGFVLVEEQVRSLAVKLIAAGGRHIDEASPCVDVRLPGGVRVHAVLPPIAVDGTLLSIRLPRAGLARLPALGLPEAEALRAAVLRRENLLITGAAGVGKTTLLAALLAEAPASERIVTIEDVAELRIDHPHVVGLEARQPNLEGAGRVGLDGLVREALRMRPDRLVVGECRGAELRELLSALNTGHDGGAGTLHAGSLADVPARLEALGALCGLGDTALARQAVSAIDRVVHLQRDGARRAVQQGRLAIDARDRLAVEPF